MVGGHAGEGAGKTLSLRQQELLPSKWDAVN